MILAVNMRFLMNFHQNKEAADDSDKKKILYWETR